LFKSLALLKKNPDKYKCVLISNSTILCAAPKYLKEVTGTFSAHIAFRGFAPMLQDILSGRYDWGVSVLLTSLDQVKPSNLRTLCIRRLQRRSAAPTSLMTEFVLSPFNKHLVMYAALVKKAGFALAWWAGCVQLHAPVSLGCGGANPAMLHTHIPAFGVWYIGLQLLFLT
jgi:Tripartite tricarboxylate transporter family receptor